MTSKETEIRRISWVPGDVTRAARTSTFVTLVAICGVLACERDRNDTERDRLTTSDPSRNAVGTDDAKKVEPDNTKKNDQPGAVTAQDQSESPEDRSITQRVRQLVMKDDSLSTAAKNVKIITTEGVVTLRGPVKSAEEKTTLASFAKNVEGVKRVDNELEVDADK